VGRSALHVHPTSPVVGDSPCVSSSESGFPHDLANPCGPWSASWTTPAVVWSVSGPGIHDELQRLVCWCVVGLATGVAKDGMTTGGYGAEYARKIRAGDRL